MRLPLPMRTGLMYISMTFVLLIAITSCGGTTPPGPNTAYVTIEDTAYTFLKWNEGLAVLIGYDIIENVETSNSGSTDDPIHRQEGHAIAADGRRVDWHLETEDGTTASFTINDQQYDLTNGNVFLVTTKGGTTHVQHLSRDLSGIDPRPESVENFAQTDADVSRFVREASEAQLPQEAQLYIQMSREALAEQVGIAPEDIELDSVTAPATPDESYIIKLVADGTTYTYHGQEQQVSLVSTER